MIGLGIVTLASIMNAAGLNITKLDHVSTGFSTVVVLWLIVFNRFEQVQYLKLPDGKTGYGRYGCLV